MVSTHNDIRALLPVRRVKAPCQPQAPLLCFRLLLATQTCSRIFIGFRTAHRRDTMRSIHFYNPSLDVGSIFEKSLSSRREASNYVPKFYNFLSSIRVRSMVFPLLYNFPRRSARCL